MAKIIDITEKLSFDENPKLVIKGKELEVKADAATVLKIMGIFGDGETTPKKILNAYNLIFSDEHRKTIEDMKISFADFTVVVMSAIELITGSEDEAGEVQTHTMT